MAWVPWAIAKPLARHDRLPTITPRLLILHTAVDGTKTTSLFDWFNNHGTCAHFYIRQDGTLEQYVDTARMAAAQFDANPFAISVETWDGSANTGTVPPWNPAQLDTIDRLARWCNTTHHIPTTAAQSWDGTGIGYHSQFYRWAKDGHTCPTQTRIAQMPGIIARLNAHTTPSTQGANMGLLAAITNSDGRGEEFRVIGGVVHHRWQTAPNNGWSGWAVMHEPGNDPGRFDQIAVFRNGDGRLEVWVRNTLTGEERHAWQTTAGGDWTAWVT